MAKKAAAFEDLWTSAREQIEAACASLGVDVDGAIPLYEHCSRVMGELNELRAGIELEKSA